jgi:hypothetical protein
MEFMRRNTPESIPSWRIELKAAWKEAMTCLNSSGRALLSIVGIMWSSISRFKAFFMALRSIREPAQSLLEGLHDHGRKDLSFAPEIAVQGRLGELSFLGDIVHGGMAISVFGEDFLRRGKDKFPVLRHPLPRSFYPQISSCHIEPHSITAILLSLLFKLNS